MRSLRDITVFCFLCICTLSFTLHCSPSVSPTESISEVSSDASTAQTEKAQQTDNETTPEIVGEWKAPLSPRDIPFYNDPAIRSASLTDMKWKLIKEGTLKSGVKVMAVTLQAWVRRTREGGRDAQKLGFVDYDALAKDADSAKSVPGVANGNWHYQCFLHWKNIPDHQMPTPATYQGVGEIYSLEDGTCTDDMNRGVLKVILHEVCAAKE